MSEADYSGEVWKDITGYEGRYQISNFGRVKSLARTYSHADRWGGVATKNLPERIMKLVPSGGNKNKDYLGVILRKDGEVVHRLVHQMVLEEFVGPRPTGMQGCHSDSNPKNNRLGNLRWGTRSENEQDKRQNGTYFNRPKMFKLTVEERREIIELYATGNYSERELGKRFGVSFMAIRYNVKKGIATCH